MRAVFGFRAGIHTYTHSYLNEETEKMKKLIAVVIASMFAMSGAFAASHAGAKDDKKADAKMEKKDDKKAEKKDEKKAEKK